MGHRGLLLSLVAAVVSVGAMQVPPGRPAAGTVGSSPWSRYGEPDAVSLHDIVSHPQFYQQRMVRTRGVFEVESDRTDYRLREEHDQVLLLSVAQWNEFEMLQGPEGSDRFLARHPLLYLQVGEGGIGTDGAVVDRGVLLVDWDTEGQVRSRSIHPFGSATSDPRSTHYADQAQLFTRRQLKPMWLDEAEIRAHLERECRPGSATQD